MSGAVSDDDDLLAAELAFGLIDGAERAAAQARLERDEAFGQAHARWARYAAALFTDTGEAPDPAVWAAIAARLPANDAGATVSRRVLRGWQFGALAASAAAILLGVLVLDRPAAVPVRPVEASIEPPMVAVLTGQAGLVTVSYDPASRHITSAAHGLALGNHSPELWVIPADGKPRSMGLINAAGARWQTVPEAASAALGAGVTIAVSIEPVGGSPTGQPTGPVILTGRMTAV